VNDARAKGRATLSALGLVRGPIGGAVMISKGGPQIEVGHRPSSFVVVGFQHELHIDSSARIARYYGANATNGHISGALKLIARIGAKSQKYRLYGPKSVRSRHWLSPTYHRFAAPFLVA
jgi:hypothetical protein